MSKIRFSVVYCSGEDPEYPAGELNTHSPHTRGWQSPRFCEYPQELGFEISGGEKHIHQIQLLSHQSKISSKIEIYIGNGDDYQSAIFKRLGYLSLDNNERSSFQARELKTVYIDFSGRFIKLCLLTCYQNKYNLFNQVGVVAINLLGGLPPIDGHVEAKRSGNKEEIFAPPPEGLQKLALYKGFTPVTAHKIRNISESKTRAVASEDFKLAKELKSVETELKAVCIQLDELELQKKRAIADEDYDLATEIKGKADEIQAGVENKLAEVNLPNIPAYVVAEHSPAPAARKPPPGSTGKRAAANDSEPSTVRSDYESEVESPQGKTPSKPPVAKIKLPSESGNKRPPLDDSRPIGGGSTARSEPSTARSHTPGRSVSFHEHEEAVVASARSDSRVAGKQDPSELYQIKAGPNDVPPGAEGKRPQSVASMRGQMREHLSGVEGIDDLPPPDEIPPKKKELCDSAGITSLVGEFVVKCMYSKAFMLRTSALKKIVLRLPEFEKSPGVSGCVGALCTIIKEMLDDKIAQVIEESVTALEAVLKFVAKDKRAKTSSSHHFEPITTVLLEKLSDGNARIRDAGAGGVEAMLESPAAGPKAISNPVLEPVPAKLKANPRYVQGRAEILTKMLQVHGVGPSSGLTADRVMSFLKTSGGYTHNSADAREATKVCTVEVSKIVGPEKMEGYLKKDLRPKQYEEFQALFAQAAADKAAGKDTKSPGKESRKAKAKADDESDSEAKPTPRRKGSTAAAPAAASADARPASKAGGRAPAPAPAPAPPTANAADETFTVCMFCSKKDANWTEDALDLHYLKECPMLLECPACAQVIEITGFPEHMLDECDHKETYVPCETTGLAVLSAEFAAWQSGPNCTAPPDGSLCCPLCFKPVVDSDDAWKKHLTKLCKKNPRIKK